MSCVTHVAPKNVHFNPTLAKGGGSVSCDLSVSWKERDEKGSQGWK